MSDVLIPSRINSRESAVVKNGEVINHRLEHMCQGCESWIDDGEEMIRIDKQNGDEIIKVQFCAPCVA